MKAFLFIVPIYYLIFLFYGRKNMKMFLLLTGIISLPLRTDYLLYGSGSHTGWTSGFMLALSDLSFIALFWYLIIKKEVLLRASWKVVFPALFFILACMSSIFNSTAGMSTTYQIFMMIKIFLLYYVVAANAIDSEEDLRTAVMFLTVALLSQGALACLQFFSGYAFDVFSTGESAGMFHRIDTWGGTFNRIYGTVVGKPNGFAGYIVPLMFINFALLLHKGRYARLRFIASILGFMALVFSFSRGGWLGFIFASVVLFIVIIKKRIPLERYVRISIISGLIVIAALFPFIYQRVTTDPADAAMSRVPLVKLAMNMIREHPFNGVGANTFTNVIREYVSFDIQDAYLYEVHNQYLLVFSETGLFGFSCFLWLLFSVIRLAMDCMKQKENEFIYYLGLGAILGIIGSMAHMMVDMFNTRLFFGSFFILAAILSGANRVIDSRYQLEETTPHSVS